jgi:hypothetical protein
VDHQRRRLDERQAAAQAPVGERPHELRRGGQVPRPVEGGGVRLGRVRRDDRRLGRRRLRIRPLRRRELLRREHERVGHGRLIEPEAVGIDEHQPAGAMRADGGELGGEHAAQGMADHIHPVQAERLDQRPVVERQPEDAVDAVQVR